jgi:hypothetical protein
VCASVRESPPNGKRLRLSRKRAGTLPGVDDRGTLTQARSMLMLLLATCKQTQTVLEAAANALDTDLTSDLGTMIERTEAELVAVVKKLEALPA